MPGKRCDALISGVLPLLVFAAAGMAGAANNKTDSTEADAPQTYTLRYQFLQDEVLGYGWTTKPP